MKQAGYVHIDPVSVAGGAKVLASPEKETDRDFMLREIEKSIRLHHTPKVMLFTHTDCGVYGGLSRFDGDAAEEFKLHTAEHARAQNSIRERFPDIAVESYFLDKEGVRKI